MENNFSTFKFIDKKDIKMSDIIDLRDWIENHLKVLATNTNSPYGSVREGVDIVHFKRQYTLHKKIAGLMTVEFFEKDQYKNTPKQIANKKYYDTRRKSL